MLWINSVRSTPFVELWQTFFGVCAMTKTAAVDGSQSAKAETSVPKVAKPQLKNAEVMKAMKATQSMKAMPMKSMHPMKAVAKAKGKAKASPKAVAKPALKKPAAAESQGGAINKSIQDMQGGLTSQDVEESRDKGMALKYANLHKAGKLPAFVSHLVEEESKKAASSRQFKTFVINRLFDRQPDGSLRLNLGSPLLQEAEELYSRTYARKAEKALPKSIMRGLYFGNSQEAMDKALAEGEIAETTEEGKKYYSFTSFEVATEQGKNTSHKMSRQSNLSQQDCCAFSVVWCPYHLLFGWCPSLV